jgi:hypothetical protein
MGLWHSIAQQVRQPAGLFGRLAGFFFRINLEGIDWTISLLEIQPTDHVLEIGLGRATAFSGWPGSLFMAGVPAWTSPTRCYSKRPVAMREPWPPVWLSCDWVTRSALPYPDNSFHKVLGTNVVYFWKDPATTLREIRRVCDRSNCGRPTSTASNVDICLSRRARSGS